MGGHEVIPGPHEITKKLKLSHAASNSHELNTRLVWGDAKTQKSLEPLLSNSLCALGRRHGARAGLAVVVLLGARVVDAALGALEVAVRRLLGVVVDVRDARRVGVARLLLCSQRVNQATQGA